MNFAGQAEEQPDPRLRASWASKGALDTMSRGFGKELAAEEVRVNVVRPWVIVTETRLSQHDDHLRRTLAQDRMGGPAEVAAVVLWLLSSTPRGHRSELDAAGGLDARTRTQLEGPGRSNSAQPAR